MTTEKIHGNEDLAGRELREGSAILPPKQGSQGACNVCKRTASVIEQFRLCNATNEKGNQKGYIHRGANKPAADVKDKLNAKVDEKRVEERGADTSNVAHFDFLKDSQLRILDDDVTPKLAGRTQPPSCATRWLLLIFVVVTVS